MNACIRAVVKAAPADCEVVGIRYGGLGLLRDRDVYEAAVAGDDPDYVDLTPARVRSILHQGSTVLKTARMEAISAFLATKQLTDVPSAVGALAPPAVERNGLGGLILIGGDTSSTAAYHLAHSAQLGIPIVVVPASIDNDIKGTQQTLGFDSALQLAIANIDCIRTTASSLDRIFVVEVMGRNHGQIALEAAFASGAEEVLIPEIEYTADDLAVMRERLLRSSGSALVLVAEGAQLPASLRTASGPAADFATFLTSSESTPNREVRLVELGHVLRGAPPTATTRALALRCGLRALDEVIGRARSGHHSPKLIGITTAGTLSLIDVAEDMTRRDTRATQAAYDEFRRLAY